MASANALCKKVLHIRDMFIENCTSTEGLDGVVRLDLDVRTSKRAACRCPICHRKCPKNGLSVEHRTWRSLDFGSTLVYLHGTTQRINCPEHGSIVANVPWAYPDSRFTKEFDRTVGWMATELSRSAVAEFMRIDWKTVGRCVSRTLNDIEPDRSVRLNGLVRIGIDETSYKKGHKYITVVVNHDTNTVVWAHPGHGKTVMDTFFQSLTEEQRKRIKVVTGDGARWITDAVDEYCSPECERCVDPFHVVEWAMDALDKVRTGIWQEANREVKQLKKDTPRAPGRPKKDDVASAKMKAAEAKAKGIKGSAYALGKAPEHLTDNQRVKLEMIAAQSPKLYRAYALKERLRLVFKLNDEAAAAGELKSWYWSATHSRIPEICDLAHKIRRHEKHILNTIRLGLSNARIEAINNKIKLIIRMAYGFRNMENMLDMVYLICSDLDIALPNRPQKRRKAA